MYMSSSDPPLPTIASVGCSEGSIMWVDAHSEDSCRRSQQPEEVAAEAEGKGAANRSLSEEEEEEEEYWGMKVEKAMGRGCEAEAVWRYLGNFGGLGRWYRSCEVCKVIEGEDDVPGCVRLVAAANMERWVIEKLVSRDDSGRCFSYDIVDSSYGFQGYRAHLSVRSPAPFPSGCACSDSESQSSSGAVITWSFRMDPLRHTSRSHVFQLLTSIFHRITSDLEAAILSPSSSTSASPPPLLVPYAAAAAPISPNIS